MGMKDAIKELGGYSALLETSSNPGMQVLGKRLGELADQLTKEQQAPSAETASRSAMAMLLKQMADWWGRNSAKSFTIELHAELSRLAYQAHCIVNP